VSSESTRPPERDSKSAKVQSRAARLPSEPDCHSCTVVRADYLNAWSGSLGGRHRDHLAAVVLHVLSLYSDNSAIGQQEPPLEYHRARECMSPL
jgi:hypothetical protein